jgi:two-component system, chemotaxis family, sensor kinase CheA
VDELLGQQQIVIKKLETAFQNIPGLSGGAILSDGCVGLILDMDGLMKLGF